MDNNTNGLILFFKRKIKRIDRFCCRLGIYFLNVAKKLKISSENLFEYAKTALFNIRRHFILSIKLFAVRNGIDLTQKIKIWKSAFGDLCKSYEMGMKRFVVHLFYISINFFARFCKCMFGSVNYFAPILAGCCFLVVVSVTLNMTFALEVKYNGQPIGYISEESVFDEAEREVLKRVVFENYITPSETVPQFSITPIKNKELSSEDKITNEIIKASGNELATASGLYIDDKFLGAVKSPLALDNLLTKVKKKFVSGEDDEEVEFVKDVQCKEGLYPVSSVVDLDYLDRVINEEESQKRVYTTVEGDSPTLIAQKNGVPYSQLKALNPDIEKKLLIGQEVMVEKAVPMLEVKVVRTVTEEEEIAFKIEQIQDPAQYQGYVEVSEAGKKGTKEVVSKVTYIDGIETSREVLSTKVLTEPENEKVVVGGKRPLAEIPPSAQTTSSNFRWPVQSGGVITCLFGNAGYYGHTGLDIGRVSAGTPVVAAASGTVVKVRYDKWGYGYHVIIDHGGNVQTLYGHNSKIYVKPGDWVEQGQVIAGMGRTGNANGVHVHFEIRVNGKYMNPVNYVGTRNPY